MGHFSKKDRQIASCVAAAVACAGLATWLPAPLVFLLVTLVVAVAIEQRARRDRSVDADLASIVQRLDGVGRGVFEPGGDPARTQEGERIGSAVHAMQVQIRTRFEQLQQDAQSDPLTGMANRAHFQRIVERQLSQRRPNTLWCMMFVDIDGFKAVNDTLGHNLGDRLLQGIAERLRIATRPDELDQTPTSEDGVWIARFGGDEFVVFLSGLGSEIPARKIANRVLRVMLEPFELNSHVAGVSASVGLAFVPADATSYSELLRAADTAMYHAKHSGRNRVELFTRQLDADRNRQVALERDLRDALIRGEFELQYQPLYDCHTLAISSAEALIRWRHPQRGLISPCEFIPLAEKSNLICDIGEWVMREAMQTIARLERRGLALRISVNVSPQQLEQMEFASLVRSSLQRSGATPRLLEIEITESLAMRDCEMAADRLMRLSELGVSIAVDDFGTGYSNLASLIRLPVSRLKIDRSLLVDLTARSEVRTLVQTIISMANGLGLHSVAEGVENAEQLDLLSGMGCDVVQGFFLSRPLEEQAFERMLGEVSGRDEAPKIISMAR